MQQTEVGASTTGKLTYSNSIDSPSKHGYNCRQRPCRLEVIVNILHLHARKFGHDISQHKDALDIKTTYNENQPSRGRKGLIKYHGMTYS